MNDYTDPVLAAAATRQASDSSGAWRLADALLTAVPPGEPGRPPKNRYPEVPDSDPTILGKLAAYAEQLTTEGIETPGGSTYSAGTLLNLRKVAAAWPPEDRIQQAAFRTHQEVGARTEDGTMSRAEVALRALGAYAVTDRSRPDEIAAEAWTEATAMVDRLTARGARYTVSANALRVALRRKANTPERDEPVTVGDSAVAPTEVGTALGAVEDDRREEISTTELNTHIDTTVPDFPPAEPEPAPLPSFDMFGLRREIRKVRDIGYENLTPAGQETVRMIHAITAEMLHGKQLAEDVEEWLNEVTR